MPPALTPARDRRALAPPTAPSLADACVWERHPGAAARPLPPGYRRRAPETTVLYQLVRAHLETFLDEARQRTAHGFGLPRWVEREFRRFLECGILALGFSRVRCDHCGDETLVAFSCQGRGACPSCNGRRMADTAAHLVDRVLPRVRVRQWVLSLPPRLRFALARDARLIGLVLRALTQVVFAWQRRRARALGVPDGRCGAITFVQRFDARLRLFVHLHVLIADGVFVPASDDGPLRFVELPAPSDADVQALTVRLVRRVTRLLASRAGPPGDDPDSDDALAFAQAESAQAAGPRRPSGHDPARRPRPGKRRCAQVDGFSLHADRAVHAHDRLGLENLCRYAARGPIAQDRLTLTAGGDALLRLKRPAADGATHVRFAPTVLLRRLASLLPPPRVHQVRYHGVFSSHSRWRARVVPEAPPANDASTPPGRSSAPTSAPGPSPTSRTPVPGNAAPDAPLAAPAGAGQTDPKPVARVEATVLERRLPWADLLRRTFAVDVLRCDRCGGPRRVLAYLTDPAVVRAILIHLALPADSPRPAPARSPPVDELALRD